MTRMLFLVIFVLVGTRAVADIFAQEVKVPQGQGEARKPAPEAPTPSYKFVPLSPNKAPMRMVCEVNPNDTAEFICHMVTKDAKLDCVFHKACKITLMETLERGEECPGFFICK